MVTGAMEGAESPEKLRRGLSLLKENRERLRANREGLRGSRKRYCNSHIM